MASQSATSLRSAPKERKTRENSPYSKNFKCYVRSDQKDLLYKRQMVTKLPRKELEDKYIDLCDENFFIKRQNNENLEKIKILQTRIVRLSEGHRCYSSSSVLREHSSNVILDGRSARSAKLMPRASSMGTIYKKGSPHSEKSSENSNRSSNRARQVMSGIQKEEKGQHEESEKIILLKTEISELKTRVDELNNVIATEREATKKMDEDKHKLEAQLSRVDMHKFLAENIEIKRLRNKFDELRKLTKRLQEKNRKLLMKKEQELQTERTLNREFQIQMKVETSTETDFSGKENELRTAARTIEILKKQISELEIDKKSLLDQQESLSALLKKAASCPKQSRSENPTLDYQKLLESIELLQTEKAAIENSKNEMFNKICKLQDINDELLVELEGYKVEKNMHDEDFIIVNVETPTSIAITAGN